MTESVATRLLVSHQVPAFQHHCTRATARRALWGFQSPPRHRLSPLPHTSGPIPDPNQVPMRPSHYDHPAHTWQVARHMSIRALTLMPLMLATLLAGMAIYHWIEHLPWPDAFLNASMLLGGMGPVDRVTTTLGKWMAGAYALFAGLVFIVTAGIMLGPVVHAVLHRFHLEPRRGQDLG